MPLTAVEPEGTPRGGIVVLHEAREIPQSLLDLLRALAMEGWLAVARISFTGVTATTRKSSVTTSSQTSTPPPTGWFSAGSIQIVSGSSDSTTLAQQR